MLRLVIVMSHAVFNAALLYFLALLNGFAVGRRRARDAAISVALAVAVAMALLGCNAGGAQTDGGDVAIAADAAAPDVADETAADADAGDDDAPPDAADASAPHEPLPTVPDMGGPRISPPALFVVTYADDPNRGALEGFAQWVVGSSWLTTVGGEYGVRGATYGGAIELTTNAPDAISQPQIESRLAAGLIDGTIRRPAGGDVTRGIEHASEFRT